MKPLSITHSKSAEEEEEEEEEILTKTEEALSSVSSNNEENKMLNRNHLRKRKKSDHRYTTRLALIMTILTYVMFLVLFFLFSNQDNNSSSDPTRNLENTRKCSDIYKISRENQCQYAKECDEGDGLEFLPQIFCINTLSPSTAALLISPFLTLFMITLFRMLGSTAEDYFSPGLEMFSTKLGLPPRFAGVSLLALGNGAADVSATMNAILGDPDEGYLLALGALTGAGMFVGCVVSGFVIVVAEGLPCRGALVRDVVMYIISLYVVHHQLSLGYVDQNATRRFIVLYCSFVCIVLIADIYHRKVVLPRMEAVQRIQETGQGTEVVVEEEKASIPVRAVRSTLLAVSNYSTMESAYLDNEPIPVLHGKHGILGKKHLVHDDATSPEDYCQNPYLAMVDTMENLEVSTFCAGEGATHPGAQGCRQALDMMKQELVEYWRDYWADGFDQENGFLERFLFCIELPFSIARKITVPVTADGYYCRGLIALSVIFSVPWFFFYLFYYHKINAFNLDGIPWFWICQFFALCIGITILRFAPGGDGPMTMKLSGPIAFYGFIIAATWIDAIGDQLVSLLTFLGVICRIPSSIMGLTILAWGNSMSDLSADLAMARRGLANMAITACYAGPVFNMLIGLAIGFSALRSSTGTSSTQVISESVIEAGFGFLFLNCIVLLISGLVLNSGFVPKSYGYVAVTLYSAYIITSLILQLR